jgi:hypothetical protein
MEDAEVQVTQFSPADLSKLLELANESLTVEHKDWLDLTENPGKAKLAKAAIALANHGGGVIVLGMRREEERGPLKSRVRSENIRRYDQDEINSAINKFSEPEIHCELNFAEHPETNYEHAFVLVPGDTHVPLMAKVACAGVIDARKCYIRKPGPKSEEPYTATEWRTLIDRCIRARREDLLDAIRAMLLGSGPDKTPGGGGVSSGGGLAFLVESDKEIQSADALIEFSQKALQRWNQRIDPLDKDDPARFPHGRYELSFEILNPRKRPTLPELRHHMQEASKIKHTGWGPFVSLQRATYAPQIIDDAIEAWLGSPEGERIMGRDPAHCDFWRASADGRLILIRGFDEDGEQSRVSPGTAFDVTLPVWRVGEAVLYVNRLAESFGDNLSIVARCQYSGLQGRKLVSITGRRWLFDDRRCADNFALVERRFAAAEVRESFATAMQQMLAPLYARFDFFELSDSLVAEELHEMMGNRF